MSKVILYYAPIKETFSVTKATVITGWLPGQGFQLSSTGEYAQIAITDNVMFIGIDATTEVSQPPTGSLVTGIYGSGTKFVIDHSAEVAAASATRAYNATCESASMNGMLYMDAVGKFTTTVTGSVKGQLWKIPSAANNYGLGVIMRI